jgi:hypothetical protein
VGRSSAARALTAAYVTAVARPEDDADVRRLLRESSFGHDVRLSLEREPDGRLASSIEGDVHATIVARHCASGAVAGIASRSVRDAFLNGQPARLGYLGQLRIDPAFRRSRELLDAGFAFCRHVHAREQDARIYLASVVADNRPARRLLARVVPGWPRFEPVDTLVSLAIPVRYRERGLKSSVELRRGSIDLTDDIVECLRRNGQRSQFFPCWTAADIRSVRTRNLEISDLVVAMRQARVVGCIACWDQRAFKQVVVRGYAPRLGRVRPLLNMVSPLLGAPRLPPIDSELRFAYLSHLAVDDDDTDVVVDLIAAARRLAGQRRLDYVVLGVSSRSPVLPAVRRVFRHRLYESVLYVGFWPDGEALARSLDSRPADPEVALL